MKSECICGQPFDGKTILDIEKSFQEHFSTAIEEYVDRSLLLRNNSLTAAGPGLYYDAETSIKGRHLLLPVPNAE